MLQTFISIAKQTKNIIAAAVLSFIIFTILRILPVYDILRNSFSIKGIPFFRKLEIFNEYIFTSFNTITTGEQILVISLSLLAAVNIVLFFVFAKRQRKMLSKRSFFASISGMFFGLFGVGCLSCGILLLAPLITFFGLGAYKKYFLEYAITISTVGIIFVILSSFYILYQLSKPQVCK